MSLKQDMNQLRRAFLQNNGWINWHQAATECYFYQLLSADLSQLCLGRIKLHWEEIERLLHMEVMLVEGVFDWEPALVVKFSSLVVTLGGLKLYSLVATVSAKRDHLVQ